MNIKIPTTAGPVLDAIKNRWSPRSFADRGIASQDMETLIEAASWAFSASNEQPWRYVVAHKATPLFDQLFQFLMPGNQVWCKDAAVLMVSLMETTIAKDGSGNYWAMHDLGAANYGLLLQAQSMDIYGHVLGGFDRVRAQKELGQADTITPVAMMALGYRDAPEKLPEPFLTRECSPRTRKPVSEIVLQRS